MRTILFAALAWLVTSAAAAQITITPEEPEPYNIIIATVNLGDQIPEGAKVRGSWNVPTCDWTPCGETIHISAKPGKHVIRASGVWVLTKDVTVGEETFPVLVDFGQYSYTKEVLVGEDPVPPPPPPNSKYEIVVFYEGDKLDNYSQDQRSLLTSRVLRQKLENEGHDFLQIVEARAITTTPEGSLADFIKSVVGDSLPRLAIRPVSGGPVQDFPLPENDEGLMKILNGGA